MPVSPAARLSDRHSQLGPDFFDYVAPASFPIHVLRETHATRNKATRAVHILVISDDGVSTMFDNDEQGRSSRRDDFALRFTR